jgi:hypothetical protein
LTFGGRRYQRGAGGDHCSRSLRKIMTEVIAVKPAKSLICGLIMPISQLEGLPPAHWDEVKEIISKTVEEISAPSFTARLVSEGDDAGVIHKRIIQNVYTDDIAICDVSGRNANVMFELGMRLAFDKPTVIIKDDQTPRIFDTDVIEYITYRRDLRYASMESFKAKLAAKVAATYQMSITNHDKQSFLKSFGTFKVVKLDEASESPDKAMLTMMTQMQRQMNRLNSALRTRDDPLKIRSPLIDGFSDEDLTRIATSKRFGEAQQFIQDWAKTSPNFSARTPLQDQDFLRSFGFKFPEFMDSPEMVRAVVVLSMV